MSDLVEFLSARLAEDEQTNREWHDRRCDGCGKPVAARGLYGLVKCMTCEPGDLPLVADRVRAEVDAKRRIMARHCRSQFWADNPLMRDSCAGCGYSGPNEEPNTEHVDDCPELRDLAAVYAGHADYDERWRP